MALKDNIISLAVQKVKNLARNLVSNVKNSYYQGVENAWKPTGIATKAINTVQGGIKQVANIPRYELPKPQVNTQNQTFNKVAQTGINLAYGIPESIINTPRNYVTGIARTGLELGTAVKEKRPLNFTNLTAGVAPLAESVFDVATLGGGKIVKNIAKEGLEQYAKGGMKQVIKQGAIKGAGYGGFGGLTYGLDTQYGKDFNVGEVTISTVAGALLGSVIGGATGGMSGAYKKLEDIVTGKVKQLKPKYTDAQVKQVAQRYIRDEAGLMRGSRPKDYDKKTQFYGDLRESLGLGRYGENIPQLGNSIRTLTKEDHLNLKNKSQKNNYMVWGADWMGVNAKGIQETTGLKHIEGQNIWAVRPQAATWINNQLNKGVDKVVFVANQSAKGLDTNPMFAAFVKNDIIKTVKNGVDIVASAEKKFAKELPKQISYITKRAGKNIESYRILASESEGFKSAGATKYTAKVNKLVTDNEHPSYPVKVYLTDVKEIPQPVPLNQIAQEAGGIKSPHLRMRSNNLVIDTKQSPSLESAVNSALPLNKVQVKRAVGITPWVGMEGQVNTSKQLQSLINDIKKYQAAGDTYGATGATQVLMAKAKNEVQNYLGDLPIKVDVKVSSSHYFGGKEPTLVVSAEMPKTAEGEFLRRISKLSERWGQDTVHISEVLPKIDQTAILGKEFADGFVLEPNVDFYWGKTLTEAEKELVAKEVQKLGLAGDTFHPDGMGMNLYNISKFKPYGQFNKEVAKVKSVIEGLQLEGVSSLGSGGGTGIRTILSTRRLLAIGNPDGGATRTYSQVRSYLSPAERQPAFLTTAQKVQKTLQNLPMGLSIKKISPEERIRGLVESAQESPALAEGTKSKIKGYYEVKPNVKLMGEAKTLIEEGEPINLRNVQDVDKKVAATIQYALNLDAKGKHNEAAILFNNLAEQGTQLGRGVQAFSLLNKMSPEAIAISAAGRIKKYNLTATKKIPELTGEQVKMISDRVKKIQRLTGRERNIAINELNNSINDLIPSSVVDKVITVWKAGLLTSLRTHERNVLGNTIMIAAETGKDPFATLADMIMSLRTGMRTITSTLGGVPEGAQTGYQAMKDVVKLGYDPDQVISKFDVKRITWGKNPVEQTLKRYTDTVFRTLSGEDKVFWNTSYARSLYDQAGAEAINAGKTADRTFIRKLVNTPTEQMKLNALNDANYATFKDKNVLTNMAAAIKRAAADPKLGRWGGLAKLTSEVLAPFTGVPSSIVGKTISYSPLGLIRGAIDFGKVTFKNVPDLQRQAAQEIGRGVIGTGLFGLGSYLMSKGMMTGQPKDLDEANQWELEGKQANSIMVGGKWRSINSIGPQSLVMLAGAKYNEEMGDPEGSTGKYAMGLIKDQLSQTFLSGVQQPLQAITDPARYGNSYLKSQVSSVVPNIVKDASKAVDTSVRESTGPKEAFQSAIPGWRNQLPPKRDVLGNVIKQEPSGAAAFTDIFNSRTPINNLVVDELSRLNSAGTNTTPGKLGKEQTIRGTKMVLTPEELNSLEAQVGPELVSNLSQLISSTQYQGLDDEGKKNAIENMVTKVRKQIRAKADITAMPDEGFTKSTDAPKNILTKIGVYGKSVVTDPVQTIKAVLNGNPIRKVENGVVVLERQNALGSLDQGNQSTVVDHRIALSLGGTNDKSNLQTLTTAQNQTKAAVEVYLASLVENGSITKKEAQQRDTNWENEIKNLSSSQKTKLVDSFTASTVSKPYQLIGDSGKVQMIDLSTPITKPTLTGYTEVDKNAISTYNSALAARKKDIFKVLNDGQITPSEAETLISQLSTKISTAKAKKIKVKKLKIPKVKKVSIKKVSIKKFKLPKIKAPKKVKIKKIKVKKFKFKPIKV